ncbi:DUF3854 domain-containing protein [Aetokthonos hydrillicola Thurmond2011]|jgi:hypothetical protein|uniref:DUF3854 domain-containing protein n=1 Tax=Aetokthonos hydrillicola Thurmond2011 TaxID=2712845 RepID=A0AAP5ICI8_9CYAN|nr:plasmid replication protein, CyRepA1 family [Aetokthonos hydrillicola]MBO3463267.1 DUF3854 domain-containing protein [Aetokthonos hydrillicola CCALA 1050]MBW4590508.1 DUF3854 domain-containing protein [Aetokthonos hydrillicola CCALA 1050]MDR9899018.1 DUF3854 domain-containing protein [Aetokthonos hydrillicola Thurmond2011]
MLEAHHLCEWHTSLVDRKLTELNVKSLSGNAALERLLFGLPVSSRRNDGRLRDGFLKAYAHVELGGWWVSGLDPQKGFLEEQDWGRFKPDQPRQNWDEVSLTYLEKLVKYESPPKTPNRVTYFRVPLHIWEMVASRYNIPMPEHVQVTENGEAIGFWQWVQQHPKIPVILTEGEKKAGCLLSFEFVAIALPGIWNGRVGKEEFEHLHPDLIPLAQAGRTFTILFDHETKPKTKENVSQAIRRTGAAIQQAGSNCKVAILPGPEKGVDDWAAALGNKAAANLTALIDDAVTLEEYQTKSHYHRRRGVVKYKPDIEVNVRYLAEHVLLPETGLVGILSDMGTGKTETLVRRRQERPEERFINIGHRVNLLKNLASRLSTQMYSDIAAGKMGECRSLSITIDSLYKLAGQLEGYDCVLIDEATQFLNHLLTSSTCQKFRREILDVLKFIIYQAKLVVLADAHLDDVTIEFFQAMRPEQVILVPEVKLTKKERQRRERRNAYQATLGIESPLPEEVPVKSVPYIIKNNYRSGGRDVYWYEGKDNSAIVASIHSDIMAGKKVLVVSSTKRFSKALERSLMKQSEKWGKENKGVDPPPLTLWTIHGENSGAPENIEFIKDINNAVKTTQVLNVSPCLGTGIDISTPHFDVIYGVFDGDALAATDAAQQLWRYRPNVPMHVWVRPRPCFGYQESNPRRIKEGILNKNQMTSFLIRLDPKTGIRGVEDEWMLDTYCQLKAQHNWSVNNLRTDLKLLLEEMGNKIIPVDQDHDGDAKSWMKEAKKEIKYEDRTKIANAKDIDRQIWEWRQQLDYLKPEEAAECIKFQIREAYGMPVTPELVEKHNEGRLLKQIIALEAVVTKPEEEIILDEQGREYPLPPKIVSEYDRSDRERHKISMDWSHRSTEWLMRQRLGINELVEHLMAGGEIAADDPRLAAVAEKARFATGHIKAVLNLTVPSSKSPMWIFSQFLGQLGLSTISQRLGRRETRVRVYSLKEEDLVFAQQVLEWRQKRREERERQREMTHEQAEVMDLNSADQAVSTPPLNIDTNLDDLDTPLEPVSPLKEAEWWVKVRAIAADSLQFLTNSVERIKDAIRLLPHQQRWAVMLTLQDLDEAAFSQFEAQFPQWRDWCRFWV